MSHPETYLGDGLYARYDGWQLWLRAPREHGDHVVALEDVVFRALLEFAAGADPRLAAIMQHATKASIGTHEKDSERSGKY